MGSVGTRSGLQEKQVGSKTKNAESKLRFSNGLVRMGTSNQFHRFEITLTEGVIIDFEKIAGAKVRS